jgi:hypothetical protein
VRPLHCTGSDGGFANFSNMAKVSNMDAACLDSLRKRCSFFFVSNETLGSETEPAEIILGMAPAALIAAAAAQAISPTYLVKSTTAYG